MIQGASRLLNRIGRRGAALLFFSCLDFLYGLSLFNPPAEAKLSASLAFVNRVAPLDVWAGLWTAVGVVCLVGAFFRHDRWAFSAAIGLKVLWGGTFLGGWILVDLDRGWVSAVVWLAMAAWVFIISSWPEPQDALVVLGLKDC